MRRNALVALVLVGIALGIWHLEYALELVFVFREGEPLTSWLTIILGPLTTLPATVIAIFHRPIAGYWLLISGLLSSLTFIVGERGLSEYVLPFVLKFSLPMAIVGLCFIVLSRVQARTSAAEPTAG